MHDRNNYFVTVIFLVALISACQPYSSTQEQGSLNNTRLELANTEKTKPARQTKAEPEIIQALSWVEQADPETDAQNAFQKQDLNFWAIYLHRSVTYPGIKKVHYDKIKEYGVKTQQGVGDTLYGGEYDVLRQKFEKYAQTYNARLLQLINNSN